jgi:hypothetical protein
VITNENCKTEFTHGGTEDSKLARQEDEAQEKSSVAKALVAADVQGVR